jgi:hypothetical protein
MEMKLLQQSVNVLHTVLARQPSGLRRLYHARICRGELADCGRRTTILLYHGLTLDPGRSAVTRPNLETRVWDQAWSCVGHAPNWLAS